MKTVKKLPALIAVCIIALIACVYCAFTGSYSSPSPAHAYGAYDFEFTAYSVTYDIRSDRTMDVRLDLTVKYLGYKSTGFKYDIPVNAGDRVRNLTAYKLNGANEEIPLDYSVDDEYSGFVTVDMDDYSSKYNETHKYRVKYEYAVTKPRDKNRLYLNAIGFGSEAVINDVSVTVNLPDGLKDTRCYVGTAGTDGEYTGHSVSGNTVTLDIARLSEYNGVTFDFEFDEGVLSTRTDMTPYYIIIGACVVFAALFVLKFLCFNKNDLTPIPSFSAPVKPPEGDGAPNAVYDDPTREMDPLVLGKLIDNKVDNSDVTSLLYYWANKGYIKINLENEKDVTLIRIYNTLPQGAPDYQTAMYNDLFKSGDVVRVNSLTNTFYPTVERVTRRVNAENNNLYDKKSFAVAVVFALLGALAMCATPMLTAMLTINRRLLFIAPLFMLVPALVVFSLTLAVKYKTLKLKKSKLILLYCAVGLLALVFSAIYAALIPSYIIETLPKCILAAIGFAIVMLSVSLVCRTEDYTEKLNRIIGFKEFIETVEKDKLEQMLESNPEFYYNVLPYAIVLGVSDKWANKFEGLTVKPPQWATGNFSDSVFSVIVFYSLMRNVNTDMARTFISRPSSGSSSGFHGSFGGFGGGGHGGGGFRGR